MATRLDVYNQVADLLGQPTFITADPSPTTELSRKIAANYREVVKEALEKTDYGFARTRAALSRVGTPAFGYAYYYQKPADCLRLLMLSPTGSDEQPVAPNSYVEEQGKYASSYEALYAFYISTSAIDAPGRWSSIFTRRVACEIALRIAPQINAGAIENITKERAKANREAIALDGAQKAVRTRRPGSWATANRRRSRGGNSGFGGAGVPEFQ